jgi:hypothetical protein
LIWKRRKEEGGGRRKEEEGGERRYLHRGKSEHHRKFSLGVLPKFGNRSPQVVTVFLI